jgi:signal transduction histidine kinase
LQYVAEALESGVEQIPARTSADLQQRHLRVVTDKLAKKEEQLEASNSQLTALLSLGPQLIQERDLDRLLQKFCRTALAMLQARHIAVAIQESDKPCVYLHASEGALELPIRYLPFPKDKLPLGNSLEERGVVRLPDLADQARHLGLAVPCPQMRPVLAVLLASRARPIGTLYFIETIGREEFSEDDERIGTMLAALLAMSLENDEQFQRVKELAAHQEGVREEERARIALEIHDELGQSLTGLKLDLAWLKTGLAKQGSSDPGSALADRIGEMSGAIDAIIRAMRRIATELRPPVLDQLGLVAAIEWQAQDFQKRTGIRCTVKAPAARVVLDQKRSIAVYRIFQEALTNVARHAEASQVTIELRMVEDHLVLEVGDNGKGMKQPPSRQGRSLGLLGMNERVTSLGGFQQIAASEGRGTRIASWIPLRENVHRPPLTATSPQ